MNIKKITILGAECTGKSTLAQDLAKALDTCHVPEYMRLYLEQKPKGYVCQYEDLLPITLGQIALEKDYLKKANRYLCCDTSPFEIMAYAFWYFNQCPDDIIDIVKNHHDDLVLLTDEIGIAWQADGMRDLPHGRHQMREHFVKLLTEFDIRFYPISGDRQSRVYQVMQLLKQIN